MVSKVCPVQRPQFGFLIPSQSKAPIALNSGQQMTALEIKTMAVNHHELRFVAKSEGLAYCIFCAELASLESWWETINGVQEPDSDS